MSEHYCPLHIQSYLLQPIDCFCTCLLSYIIWGTDCPGAWLSCTFHWNQICLVGSFVQDQDLNSRSRSSGSGVGITERPTTSDLWFLAYWAHGPCPGEQNLYSEDVASQLALSMKSSVSFSTHLANIYQVMPFVVVTGNSASWACTIPLLLWRNWWPDTVLWCIPRQWRMYSLRLDSRSFEDKNSSYAEAVSIPMKANLPPPWLAERQKNYDVVVELAG